MRIDAIQQLSGSIIQNKSSQSNKSVDSTSNRLSPD